MGSRAPSTTTTIQRDDPPAYLQPYLTDIARQAQSLAGTPRTFYPGRTFADLSPETATALARQAQRASEGSPLTRAAGAELTRTLAGAYLDGGNPHFARMMDRVAGEIRPRLDAQFAASGRYGSGAHANAVASALAETAGQLAYQDYGRERENMMRAMLFAPELAREDYADLAKLAEVGGVREDFAQQAIDEAIARHDFAQAEPWQRLAQYAGIIQGQNTGGVSTTTRIGPRRSLGAGLLGGAMTGAGLATLLAGGSPWLAAAGLDGGLLGGLWD